MAVSSNDFVLSSVGGLLPSVTPRKADLVGSLSGVHLVRELPLDIPSSAQEKEAERIRSISHEHLVQEENSVQQELEKTHRIEPDEIKTPVEEHVDQVRQAIMPVAHSEELLTPQQRVERSLDPDIRVAGMAPGSFSMKAWMDELGIPGVSIAVIHGGEFEWAQGYGELEQKTGSPIAFSQAASVSKTVTALAVLSLIDHCKTRAEKGLPSDFVGGKALDLQTDIREILPESLCDEIDPHGKERTPGQEVTIQRLLAHTAGTSVSGFLGFERPQALEKLNREIEGLEKAQGEATSPEVRASLEESLKSAQASRFVLERELEHASSALSSEDILLGRSNTPKVQVIRTPDDEHFLYSGGGTMILQKVIETLTHQKFEEVVRERVFVPLHMENSSYFPPEERCVPVHERNGQPLPGLWRNHSELAAAGLWTTSRDLAQVVRGIQHSVAGRGDLQSLSPERAREMIQPVPGRPSGLGCFLEQFGSPADPTIYFYHHGENSGYRSVVVGNNRGDGVVILTDSDNGGAIFPEILRSVAKEYRWQDAESLSLCQPRVLSSEVDPNVRWSPTVSGTYRYQDETSRHDVKIYFSEAKEKVFMQLDEEPQIELQLIGPLVACYRKEVPGPYQLFRFTDESKRTISLPEVDAHFTRV